ncbi:MAG: AbrB/MazE/SpoVT family DNA-binding domain-containing protein, partial [Candidatus Korarchaeota archaeon]|nr:AbrB/MazE/SpoVT family DNA-binding domain-containing protein [Candidatus Korarchaeota archaeon]
MGVSKVSRKGLTNIPSKVRREAGIEEGDLMVWEVEGREVIRVRIVKDPLKHLKGKYDDPDLTYD